MNNEEWLKLVEEFKAQGLEEKDILKYLYDLFLDGKIGKEDLSKLGGTLGYELSPEFLQDEKPSPIEAGGDVDTPNLTKEDIESAKEISPDDEDDGESDEASNDGESDGDDSEDERDDSKDDDSEDEKEEAKKLFGLD